MIDIEDISGLGRMKKLLQGLIDVVGHLNRLTILWQGAVDVKGSRGDEDENGDGSEGASAEVGRWYR
jgi:hypothetical protein